MAAWKAKLVLAMIPMAIILTNPLIGLPALFVVLLGLLGGFEFPFRLPAGLVAIGLGIVIAVFRNALTVNVDELHEMKG